MTYVEYINSKQWKHKRLLRLKIDKFKCRTCNNEENLEVHHVTYDRLFNENVEDLITLCKDCHVAITSVIRKRRFDNRTIKFNNQERQQLNYVEKDKSKVDWGITPNSAQRPTGESSESGSKRSKEDFWETF